MARPKATAVDEQPVDLLEKYKDFGGIKVIERRMLDPESDPGSPAIRLKDEPSFIQDPRGKRRIWHLRWVNGGQEGRYSAVIDGKGYVPVRRSELQNPDSVTGLHIEATDGADPVVRRGDRGQEILAKIPLELYTELKRRQQDARQRRARNAKLVKQDLADSAGRELGSEAGDAIHDEFSVEVRRGRRTTLGAEMGLEEDRA